MDTASELAMLKDHLVSTQQDLTRAKQDLVQAELMITTLQQQLHTQTKQCEYWRNHATMYRDQQTCD